MLFVWPIVSYAECSPSGYTIEYINGIATSRVAAEDGKALLQEMLPRQLDGQPLTVQLAYNGEHLGGLVDVVFAVSQALFNPVSDYNLNAALRDIAANATTQKFYSSAIRKVPSMQTLYMTTLRRMANPTVQWISMR